MWWHTSNSTGRSFLDFAEALSIQLTGGIAMAATSQQGTYLGTTLAGFTALTAGLAGLGVLVALVGLFVLIVSAVGFYRIKSAESTK